MVLHCYNTATEDGVHGRKLFMLNQSIVPHATELVLNFERNSNIIKWKKDAPSTSHGYWLPLLPKNDYKSIKICIENVSNGFATLVLKGSILEAAGLVFSTGVPLKGIFETPPPPLPPQVE